MQSVYDLVKRIPKGKVTTYGFLAKATGLHPRQIAALMKKNKSKGVPCHRVVMSNGKIGGYNKGIEKKIDLLKKEGIKVKNGKIINFGKKLFFPIQILKK